MTEEIMSRLRFSRAEIDATKSAVEHHMVFKDVQKMRISKLKHFMARPGFADELELHRVDCTSSNGMLDNYDFIRAKTQEFAAEPLIPPPLIGGNDLKALGLPPGPRYKEILEAVSNRQLEGTLVSAEEALAFVRENFLQPH
jgi:poly(A) polymerase